ncbi:MAG: hypothetical protein LBL55_06760 [Propionibacteriaceae bacterium]|jgi:hypothetical protein|nr:hypothetical protein [Propionibacteriaceae bacterium]
MRLRSVVSEAWRDLTSGAARALLWALCLIGLAGLLTALDLSIVNGLQRDAAAYQAGAANLRLSLAQGAVDGAACDRLALSASVAAAGAIRPGPAIRLSAAPDTPVGSFAVTPGFGPVLGLSLPLKAGVWVDSGLAESMGLAVGDRLDSDQGVIEIVGVFAWPSDGRDARLSFALLLPETALEMYDECWIRAWPVIDDNDILLRSVALVDAGSNRPPMIDQANKSLGSKMDAHALFSSRPTRWAALVAGLVGLGLGFASIRRRRLEQASALHCGQRRVDQLLSLSLQTWAWALPALLVVEVASLVLIRVWAMPDPDAVWLTVAGVPLWAGLGAWAGGLIAAGLTREKHLFRYFKTR